MHYSPVLISLASVYGFFPKGTYATPGPTYPVLTSENHAAEMMQLANVTDTRRLETRQDGGIIICTDINWQGTCGYAKQPWNTCIQLTAPYWHTISSIGPDQFNAVVLYSDFDCTDPDAITITYPGKPDLTQVGKVNGDGSWNDHTGSFRVFQIPGADCLGYDIDFVGSFPDTNCQWCCGGCTIGGEDCCPQGAFC
ncbi:hypothetical protein F5884DRAFT_113938 [Xylogone sp. PMI_703]|nr:hypothetical protein F5884DRAFT_113938 [Xylogone sp. PMI_703]